MAAKPVAQDRYLRVNGLRLHYLDWGDAAATPVLLLHGVWWNAHVWDALAPALADRFHVLALDQRGHGETSWAENYGWVHWVEDLEGFQRALDLDRPALIGHSLGGMMAYMFAGRHPDAVRRLAVLDMGPEQRTPTLVQIQAQAAMVTDVPFESQADAIAAIREAVPLAEEGLLANAVRHNLKQEADGTWRWRYDVRRRTTGRRERRPEREAQWEALRAITCPTLLVRGAGGIVPPETAQRMAREMQDCRLVEVADSGHNPHMEQSAATVELLRGFLQEERTLEAQ